MEKYILKIVNEQQLVSVMNTTKWHKLIDGMATLPFEPAFQLKVITQQELVPPTFSEKLTYVGDWQHLEIKTYKFSTIEWLKIRPFIYRHVGQLVQDEKIDISHEVKQLLASVNLHFEQVNEDFIVYGYLQSKTI